MESLFTYILQTAIGLSLFFLIYFFLLRKMTFFKMNRLFLLCGIVVAFILPAIPNTYDVPIHIETPYVPEATTAEETAKAERPMVESAETETFQFPIYHLLLAVYALGVLFMLFRNINTFRNINNIRQTGYNYLFENYRIIKDSRIETPFSFLQSIYVGAKALQQKEEEVILRHEISHIKQSHWIDLLISEFALTFMWFNPLMWYYVYLIKENHEFLVDKRVLQEGESLTTYRAVLINQRFQGEVFSFTSPFNYSNYKNRLKMMEREKSPIWKRVAIIAILPLIGIYFSLSAQPNYVVIETEVPQLEQEPQTETFELKKEPFVESDTPQIPVATEEKSITKTNKKESAVAKEVFTPIKENKADTITIRSISDSKINENLGTNSATIANQSRLTTFKKSYDIESVRREREGNQAANKARIDSLRKLYTRIYNRPAADHLKGAYIDSSRKAAKLPYDANALSLAPRKTFFSSQVRPSNIVTHEGFNPKILGKRLIILNGKEMDKDDPNLTKILNSKNIDVAVKILKSKEGEDKYGEKGKHGVTIYNTKPKRYISNRN